MFIVDSSGVAEEIANPNPPRFGNPVDFIVDSNGAAKEMPISTPLRPEWMTLNGKRVRILGMDPHKK